MTPVCPFFPVLSVLVKVLSPSFLLYGVTLLSPLLLNLWGSTLRLIKYPGKVELSGYLTFIDESGLNQLFLWWLQNSNFLTPSSLLLNVALKCNVFVASKLILLHGRHLRNKFTLWPLLWKKCITFFAYTRYKKGNKTGMKKWTNNWFSSFPRVENSFGWKHLSKTKLVSDIKRSISKIKI